MAVPCIFRETSRRSSRGRRRPSGRDLHSRAAAGSTRRPVSCMRDVLPEGCLRRRRAQVLTNMPVSLRRREGLWEAVSAQGVVVARAPKAVVCAALATPCVLGLARGTMGLSPLYGRISLLRETDLPELRCALTGDGYVARTEGFCAVGATYEPGEAPTLRCRRRMSTTCPPSTSSRGVAPTCWPRAFTKASEPYPPTACRLRAAAGRSPSSRGLLSGACRSEIDSQGAWSLDLRGLRLPRAHLGACVRKARGGGRDGRRAGAAGSLAAKLDPARFLPKLLAG